MSDVLPTSFLRCLSDEDRKSLGKAGMLPEEATSKQLAKSERQLQGQIVGWLRIQGVEPCWHRTDKKSAATVGWPDITFAVESEVWKKQGWTIRTPVAWEVKFGDGQLSKEQVQMHVRLSSSPNCWKIAVIRSMDEAIQEFKRLTT